MNPFKFFGSTLCLAVWLGSTSPVAPQGGNPQSSAPQWSETQSQSDYRDPYAGWWRGALEGYTDKSSARQGETIAFKVSVYKPDLQPGSYTVEIFRVGASPTSDQLMTSLGSFTSPFLPLHDKTGAPIYPGDYNHFAIEHRTGCDVYNWPIAFQLTVPLTWPSGFYYARLILSSDPTKFGRIPFVVKEDSPGSTSKILCVIAWNTYQAYNYWGGGSLYWWTGTYDSTAKAFIDTVSFKRPFGLHHHWDEPGVPEEHRYKFVDQLGQLHHRERQFINWAESKGYTMEYCIDLDVHDPTQGLALLSNYKTVAFPGHSEYWSRSQRINTKNFLAGGGNLAFFAANNCYWQVDFHSSNSKIYCNKPDNQYWWRKDPQEGPESKLIGIMFGGLVVFNSMGSQTANTVTNAAHWLFSGTGLSNGASLGVGLYNSQPDLNVDPLVAGEADMRPKSIYMPANVEVLARRYVRNLFSVDEDSLHGGHYNDPRFPYNLQESNQLYSEVTYYEDTGSNARVFAAGGHGWCNSLYGTDGNTMGIVTRNILDHFSFKKYRGNIYTNILTWGDETLETSTILDGDTYILPQKTLSLVNGFTLTINPGVTLYVQGTLSLAPNVTISGGGTVVTQGSGVIMASNSAEATAFNNSRKIVRDTNGDYHVLFETEGEICYEKLNGSTALTKFQRLSSGNGNNKYPCIAERGGNLFVVWQRYDGSSYDIHFRKFMNGTWASAIELASNVGTNAPLPVIASPATNELMAVYRSGNNLAWKRSTDNGSTWPTTDTITGTALNSPSLAPGKTPWGVAAPILAYATNVIPNASNLLIHYYYNDWSSASNLSSNLPGNLSQHANPSIAGSGDLTSSLPHTAWDAYDSQYSGRVILHKHGWGSSSYYEFHYQTEDRPSITGLAGITAEMIFRRGSNNFFTGHYNGTYWDVPINPQPGKYPSFSLGSTQAKYVITSGSAAPYEVKVSTSTFSKASLLAENIVRRAVGLVNPASGAWLNLRVENFLVKHKDGSSSFVEFSAAPPDTAILSSSEAWAALSSADFVLPADAESLVVVYSVAGDRAASLSDGQAPLTLQFKAETLGDESSTTEFQPLSFASNEAFSQSNLRTRIATEGWNAGARLAFKTYVIHQRTDEKVVASLGHIYHFTDGKESASLKPLASHTSSFPEGYVLEQNYPNPFNPETEIRFGIPKNTRVAIRIYNVSGQLVATLYDGQQVAGNHAVRWNGVNSTGERVSSGVYFYKLETADFVQTRKLIFTK